MLKSLRNTGDDEAKSLYNVISALHHFGCVDLHVIKVNQLGDIKNNRVIPLNVHYETKSSVIQGCLPIFVNGQGELPEAVLSVFSATIDAINIAIKSIIPNLQIDIETKNIIEKEDGKKYVHVDVYSTNRNGKKFLIR